VTPAARRPRIDSAPVPMRRSRHHGIPLAAAILIAPIVAAPAAASTGLIYSAAGAGFLLRPTASIPPPTGDGGPAGLARLTFPTAVAATPDGGFLVAETERHRVRRVSSRGIITTIAGTGRGGFSGDAGPPREASLWLPRGVTAAAGGGSWWPIPLPGAPHRAHPGEPAAQRGAPRGAAGAAAGRPQRRARRPDRERLGAGHRPGARGVLVPGLRRPLGHRGGWASASGHSHGLAAAQGADLRMVSVPRGACFALSSGACR
jgi:NHL repeat